MGGYWISPAGMPRMTFANTTNGKPQTPQYPELANGLLGVHGAGGMKATLTTDPGTENQPIAANQNQEQGFHVFPTLLQKFNREVRRTSTPATSAGVRATTTISKPLSGVWLHRKDSRITRLMRLRWLARTDTRRDTVTPNRAW